jgi:hypothetical protein
MMCELLLLVREPQPLGDVRAHSWPPSGVPAVSDPRVESAKRKRSVK